MDPDANFRERIANGCDTSPDYLLQRDVDRACADLGLALEE